MSGSDDVANTEFDSGNPGGPASNKGSPFKVGQYVVYQCEHGELGPVRVLENYEDAAYKLDLSRFRDLIEGKSTVYPWELRLYTEETQNLKAHDLDTRDVDMQDLVEDLNTQDLGMSESGMQGRDEDLDEGMTEISEREADHGPGLEVGHHAEDGDGLVDNSGSGAIRAEAGTSIHGPRDRGASFTPTPISKTAHAPDHVLWAIMSSTFDKRSKDPFTGKKGIVKYDISEADSGNSWSLRYTEIPSHRVEDFIQWHRENPGYKVPEAWQVQVGNGGE